MAPLITRDNIAAFIKEVNQRADDFDIDRGLDVDEKIDKAKEQAAALIDLINSLGSGLSDA